MVPGVTEDEPRVAQRREFADLLDLEAPVEQLASGFTFTEGVAACCRQ